MERIAAGWMDGESRVTEAKWHAPGRGFALVKVAFAMTGRSGGGRPEGTGWDLSGFGKAGLTKAVEMEDNTTLHPSEGT